MRVDLSQLHQWSLSATLQRRYEMATPLLGMRALTGCAEGCFCVNYL
jgi:hypothetical protein